MFLENYFQEFKHIKLEIPNDIDWLNETAIQKRIIQFDIGIATLLNNEFHRSKSGFKAKQCLANGVPVISTDIKENNKFVTDRFNGFYCKTINDFLDTIERIKEMEDREYDILIKNARNSISNFNHFQYCDTLINSFDLIR